MLDIWARYVEPSGQPGPDYWRYFARRLADLASIPEGAAILDVGTYDGNVLFKAMKKAGAGCYGLGVDIDYDGLQEGLILMRDQPWRNVAFAQMDASCLALASEMFDVILANFVGWDDSFDFDRLAFIAPDMRITEIKRVLKPGGQVGLGFWVEQSDIDWFVEAFRTYLPEAASGVGGSLLPYAKENPEGYEMILRSGGFQDICVHTETVTFVSPDEDTWWRQMHYAARKYFDQIPDAAQQEWFRERVFADLQPLRSAQGIAFTKTVAFSFGTKSG